ncbi:PilZ domain-containing protein [Methylobacterium sp. B4]|uniref:PilZ domain-containing protein n=1 Tax=Methylobacterium sp. B4 TaxID=1938755 RepID=UPI000D754E2E
MSYIENRRSEPRTRVNEGGLITLDEHTSIGCFVHDISAGGIKITLLDAISVPNTFVLIAPCVGDKVCQVVWRTDEMIGAKFE